MNIEYAGTILKIWWILSMSGLFGVWLYLPQTIFISPIKKTWKIFRSLKYARGGGSFLQTKIIYHIHCIICYAIFSKNICTGLPSKNETSETNVRNVYCSFITDSRSTFEFPSRVHISGPSLYCIVRTLVK